MGPHFNRWSDVKEDYMQTPVEIPTLEDTPSKVQLASGTDIETTQNQGVPNEIQM